MRLPTVIAIAVVVLAFQSAVEAGSILVFSGGYSTNDSQIEGILEGYGHTVDIGPQYGFYSGSSLSAYDAVLLLVNYNWSSSPDMPAAGQAALLSYVSGGGGLVTSEWFIWDRAAQSKFVGLDPLIPVVPSTAFRTVPSVTYTEVTADATLNAGLPSSFSFDPGSISGSETFFAPKPGATVYYDSDYGDGVIGWDFGSGKVLSFSTLMSIEAMSDADYGRLVSNALDLAAGTQQVNPVPEPASIAIWGLGALGLVTVGAVRRRRRK